MKRSILIEHIPTGKKWESDWEETNLSANAKIEYNLMDAATSVTMPYNGIDICIPSGVLNECVTKIYYQED